MSRSWLEENNWLQGSFVSCEDLELLRRMSDDIPEGEIYLITASQSCDACASEDKEEFIEFSIARAIEKVDGNYLYNKNPRRLHLKAEINDADEEFKTLCLELLAQEKIRLKKKDIEEIKKIRPCRNITLRDTTISQYANWLAARYNRPALPSAFEKRFNDAWNRGNRDKKMDRVSESVIGVYVDIFPDKELNDTQNYDIDLLFLITEKVKEDSDFFQEIKALAEVYKQALTDANCNLGGVIIKTKQEVSIATLESYKRLIYDNLSYKNDQPLPPSIN